VVRPFPDPFLAISSSSLTLHGALDPFPPFRQWLRRAFRLRLSGQLRYDLDIPPLATVADATVPAADDSDDSGNSDDKGIDAAALHVVSSTADALSRSAAIQVLTGFFPDAFLHSLSSTSTRDDLAPRQILVTVGSVVRSRLWNSTWRPWSTAITSRRGR